MKILQKEELAMTGVPDPGGVDVRDMIIQAHISTLIGQADAERRAHESRPTNEAHSGLRRHLGLTLVRVGRALADDPPGAPIHTA